MSDKLCQLEAQLVRDLGNRIGFGRMMQLAEEGWGDLLESRDLPRGGAHSTGPCVTFLVRCDHNGKESHKCDWCCGAGRVTKRVAREMASGGLMESDAPPTEAMHHFTAPRDEMREPEEGPGPDVTSRYGSPEELMSLVDEYLDGLDANCHPPTNRAEPHDNAGWFATPSRYNIKDLESHVAAYFKADLDDFNEHVPVLALKVLARYAIMAREKCDIIKDLEASVTQRDAEIEELREEVVGEMAVTLKRSVSLQKASDEVARLREELNNVRHDNKVLIGLIERLREELNNVRHNNKVLTARADSLGELLLASEESVQNRNKRIEELREERDAARAVCKEQAHILECVEPCFASQQEDQDCEANDVTKDVAAALRAALGKDGEI